MLALKQYQQNALQALNQFLQACRSQAVTEAYHASLQAQQRESERYSTVLPDAPDTPCVCLRLPTGGGKTLLAAHVVAIAGKAVLDSDAPVALWLTPSDTIRAQTLDALANTSHPYRQALANDFGDKVTVCDLDSLQTVSPHDIGKNCIVVVATIQSFNVTDTAKRNVYAFYEELAPHFDGLPAHLSAGLEKVTDADLENQRYLTAKDLGRVKFSVANWLHLMRPVVIVDEAHNYRTDRFFKTMGRLNPACVVELTATPVPGNNVLYHVSAQELRAEQMIKLPIVLAEHPQGWQECVRDAILTRNGLELVAQKEREYVRPIVLLQAMPKGGEATVDVVKAYLLEEKIPEEQIAIATGTQKELDGIDLFDPATPVRYVITVEALKEGWDCSFAYVLASLQSVNSSKDVEQLLGRVLRMPYARDRLNPELNKAYAHIVAENFSQAASALKDRMVQNMGFNRLETASLVVPQQTLPLSGGGMNSSQNTPIPDAHIEIEGTIDTQHWPEEVKAQIEVRATTQGTTLIVKGTTDNDTLKQVETFVVESVPAKAREKTRQQFAEHHATRRALRSPMQLGMQFAPIPQLCLAFDGHLEVVERETLAQLGDWNLLDYQIQLENFSINETVNTFEIKLNGDKITYANIAVEQLHLNDMQSSISQNDLVRWLDRELKQTDVPQLQLQAYLLKMLSYLTHDRGIAFTALTRARHQLASAIREEIKRLRKLAIAQGFQGRLFDMAVPAKDGAAHCSFRFEAGKYPARNIYQGSYAFQKHFYPEIHDLREKTPAGKPSEEFECAKLIAAHPKVKYWVRNIEQQERFSFWLPTATDYFYPDFIAELVDGRILAVEYKGEIYKTNDDSKEKAMVGEQWERASNGQCLFLFAVAKDELGRNVAQQLNAKLQG